MKNLSKPELYTPENITSLQPHEVFVFGSNIFGQHTDGSAAIAVKKFGVREGVSKYIAISGYFGGFSILVADSILNGDFKSEFQQELDFCLSEHLLSPEEDELRITRKGFKYYGAVFSLFYKRINDGLE